MCVFLIWPADSLEDDSDARLRGEFVGLMNLYWACTFGHRMGVHAKLTDEDVVEAIEEGSPEEGYILRVRLLITNAKTYLIDTHLLS